jgi:hypothetical protein
VNVCNGLSFETLLERIIGRLIALRCRGGLVVIVDSSMDNTTQAPTQTPVMYSIGGVIGLSLAWGVVAVLAIIWIVTMCKRMKHNTHVMIDEDTPESNELMDRLTEHRKQNLDLRMSSTRR